MKKSILSLLFFFLMTGEGFATSFLGFGDSELRFRGKTFSSQKGESAPFTLVEERDLQEGGVLMKTPEGVEITQEEDKILSPLGGIWDDFKEGKDSARTEFVRLGLMLDEPDPKALYLLGKVCTSFYTGIEFYTNALTNSEEGSPIYNLALKAILECQEEALRRSRERDL